MSNKITQGLTQTETAVKKQQIGADDNVMTGDQLNRLATDGTTLPTKEDDAKVVAQQQPEGTAPATASGANTMATSVKETAQEAYKPNYYANLYQVMHQANVETPEMAKRRQRRERSNAMIRALGDGIASIANIYHSAKDGTPNMQNVNGTLSKGVKARIAAAAAQREKNRQLYEAGLMDAQGLDNARNKAKATQDEITRHNQAQEAIGATNAVTHATNAGINKEKLEYKKENDPEEREFKAQEKVKDRDSKEKMNAANNATKVKVAEINAKNRRLTQRRASSSRSGKKTEGEMYLDKIREYMYNNDSRIDEVYKIAGGTTEPKLTTNNAKFIWGKIVASHPEMAGTNGKVPAKPATKPAKPATKPAKPATKPAKPATKPAKPATKPAKPATKPAKPATKKGKLSGMEFM